MNLFERFTAGWKAFTGADISAIDGKPELTEENVAALEAAAKDLETVKADNDTLKGENQAHAERITELEATVEAAATSETVISAALEANNVEVPEGTDLASVVAEKINAWGKTVPAATAAVSTSADDLGDGATDETIYSEIDKRAQAQFKRNKK